jgi:hypothetical protein
MLHSCLGHVSLTQVCKVRYAVAIQVALSLLPSWHMNNLLRILLIAIPLLVVVPHTAAQEGISRKKQEKIQKDKAKEEKKELAKRDKEGRKRHLSIQDKETRKRIKRNTKRADRRGTRTHKDGFFRRLFSRKR